MHPQQTISAFPTDLLRLCVWLLLLLAVFTPLERLFALHRQKFFRRSFGNDLAFYFLSGFVPKLFIVFPLTIFAKALHHFMPGGFYPAVAGLPFWLRAATALLVGEIGAYWGHRWSHQIPFLWRFHSLHHDAEEMDWLVSTRAHPADLIFVRLCSFVPMYALGLAQPTAGPPDLAPVLVTLLGTVWGFFIHANLKWRLGPLESLVASPAFHHWHHTADNAQVTDRNYAAMLPCIDKLFGTFYLPSRQWPRQYGLLRPSPPADRSQP